MLRLCLCAFALLNAASLVAGPLDPPSTPTSTPAIEPRIGVSAETTPGDADSVFRIANPGSYYLVGNVQGEMGKYGIEIASSGVTLDLCGFTLSGFDPSGDTLAGITAGSGLQGIVIRSGILRDWDDEGVKAAAPAQVVLENLVVRDCGGTGISAGDRAIVNSCTVEGNAGGGIYLGVSASVRDCNASGNTFDGINAGEAAMVTRCTADGNSGRGISTGTASVVESCTARQNTDDGIAVSGGVVRGCTARQNGDDGILGESVGGVIESCMVSLNTGDGIEVFSQFIVRGCVATGSGFNGDGAGINATNTDNRIEGNSVYSGDRGIQAAGNDHTLVVGNLVNGNTTDFDIASGNVPAATVTNSATLNSATNATVNINP